VCVDRSAAAAADLRSLVGGFRFGPCSTRSNPRGTTGWRSRKEPTVRSAVSKVVRHDVGELFEAFVLSSDRLCVLGMVREVAKDNQPSTECPLARGRARW
jgi:hypothetical protein